MCEKAEVKEEIAARANNIIYTYIYIYLFLNLQLTTVVKKY